MSKELYNLVWGGNLKWVTPDPINNIYPKCHSTWSGARGDDSGLAKPAEINNSHRGKKRDSYGPQDQKAKSLGGPVVCPFNKAPNITLFALVVVNG